jgi:hypothetical protein
MLRRFLTTVSLFALLAPATASAFSPIRTARFTATISGAQTTKWNAWSGTDTDCHGTRRQTGEGTEVFRFAVSRPEKVLLQSGISGPTWKFGTWDPFSLDSPLGLIASARLTRYGQYTTTWSGGWCGQPAPEISPATSDCGQRPGFVHVYVGPYDRKLKVEVIPSGVLRGFDNCPVNSPTGVDDGAFTDAFGRLSNALAFGQRKRIVVEQTRVYRRHDATTPGVDALSTVHFRLVLVRHGH